MASFLTTTQKNALHAVMIDIHDTFKRTLKCIKEGQEIVLSTNPNYNHIYKQPLDNIERSVVERDIEARIYYIPRKTNENVSLSSEGSLQLDQPAEEVRLKLIPDDYEFVKESSRFIVDGVPYAPSSPAVPNGLFGSGFYTIYLKRVS